MIARVSIFPLARPRLAWHLAPEAIQDAGPWSANSHSGRSGDTNATSRPTKGSAAPMRFCTAGMDARATPNVRSGTLAFGMRSPRSASGSRIVALRQKPCVQTAPFMPIGRKNRPIHQGVDASAVAAKVATDGSGPPVTAANSPSVVLPCPPLASPHLRTRNPRPTSLASRQMGQPGPMAAAGSIVRSRPAMGVADAIAVRPADSRPASCADSRPKSCADSRPASCAGSGNTSCAADKTAPCPVCPPPFHHARHLTQRSTPAEVASLQPGVPYPIHTSPARRLTRRRQRFGDTP